MFVFRKGNLWVYFVFLFYALKPKKNNPENNAITKSVLPICCARWYEIKLGLKSSNSIVSLKESATYFGLILPVIIEYFLGDTVLFPNVNILPM